MSTKKIRKMCEILESDPRFGASFKAMATDALAEVEAIEKAARWSNGEQNGMTATQFGDLMERIVKESAT